MKKQKINKKDKEKKNKFDAKKRKEIKKKIRDKEEHVIGDIKDKLSDKLDKISDKIDDLSDRGKLDDAKESSLKKKISDAKGRLDVPKETLQKLIKKRIIHHFADQMTDEILEVIHDEVAFKEKIKESLYKNKKIRGSISNLIKNKIIRDKKHDKRK